MQKELNGRFWRTGTCLVGRPSMLLPFDGVKIRRILILTREQMQQEEVVADSIEVMDDQARTGIKIFFAFREELERSLAFQRFQEDYRKQGAAEDVNAAMFDVEILIFSRTYGTVPLGVVGKPTQITMVNELEITWKPDLLRDLNPDPLFDMTRYVFPYEGPKTFKSEVARFKRSRHEVSV